MTTHQTAHQTGHEILHNPATTETIRVLESTPERFTIDYSLKPHAHIAATHIHPFQRQRFSVTAGTLVCMVDGKRVTLKAGESVVLDPGAVHDQANPHDVEVQVIEEYQPAARMHDFFRVYFALARDGLTNAAGMPPLLLTAAVFHEFRDSIQPGPRVLRVLVSLLAPVARLFGRDRVIRRYLAAEATLRPALCAGDFTCVAGCAAASASR
jgi:mannose-6-phosphate isomerase-like protein (cupin superfamily)